MNTSGLSTAPWRGSERFPVPAVEPPVSPARWQRRQASPAGSGALEQQLAADLATLSPKLQQVAGYCLQHARTLHLCRILDVAAHCNTQPVTVVRLAKRYGFRGFLDFKMAFLAPVAEEVPASFCDAAGKRGPDGGGGHRHRAPARSDTSPGDGAMLGAMKTLLCFGDSNTHGTVPMQAADEVARLGLSQRWPGVLRTALGTQWCVVEEGMPGRTTSFDDPDEGEDRNALRYWAACLQSHRPLDAIVLMLGTNDLKSKFGASPQVVADALGRLIGIARQNTPPGCAHPSILLVAPVPIRELGFFSDMFAGGARKSLQLAPAMARIAEQHGTLFLDAGVHCAVSTVDGIHLDAQAHRQLGLAVASTLAAAFAARGAAGA